MRVFQQPASRGSRLALVLILALQTGACGLKGDLYLPEEQAEQQAPPSPAPTESPSEDEGADENGDEPGDAAAADE